MPGACASMALCFCPTRGTTGVHARNAQPLALGSTPACAFQRRLLAQMKYRPWHGVFLNDKYIASVEGAREITQQVLRLYSKYNVAPLVESSVSTSAELRQCLDMLDV